MTTTNYKIDCIVNKFFKKKYCIFLTFFSSFQTKKQSPSQTHAYNPVFELRKETFSLIKIIFVG
jgi:hypothetical protein